MQLQTQIPFSPALVQIDYQSHVLLLGSCFVTNIGAKLENFQFRNLQNPFGILFHPASIQRLMERASNQELFTEDDVFETEGHWHCFEVHSLVHGGNKQDYVSLLNEKLQELGDYVKKATHIVLTFGTSWVYRNIASQQLVANCHKVSQKEFTKELVSVEEVARLFQETEMLISGMNPEAVIIGTVSPVRHLKDGFVENSRSKAHLIAGLHACKSIHYFPSYEIVMDELRDYRFYEKDMIHPNETAISIIWDYFNRVWIASETANLQKEIAAVQQGLQHRPFYPDSDSNRAFQKKLQQQILELKRRLPHLTFS